MGGDDGAGETPDVIVMSRAEVLAARRRFLDTLPVRDREALRNYDHLLGWPPAPLGFVRWPDVKARRARIDARRALDPTEIATSKAEAAERAEYLGPRAEAADERGASRYAWHGVIASAFEEHCSGCGEPATHKIGDQSGPPAFHELTAYTCCSCMRNVGMDCALYPPH